MIFDPEQSVNQAGIPHIDLRRLHEPFSGVDVKGAQPSDKQQIDQKIDIAGDRRALIDRLAAKRDALSNPPWLWASIIQSRSSVSAGMRRPNCGTSRSR